MNDAQGLLDSFEVGISDGYFAEVRPGVVTRVARGVGEFGYRLMVRLKFSDTVVGEQFGMAISCNNYALRAWISPTRYVTGTAFFETLQQYENWLTRHIDADNYGRVGRPYELDVFTFQHGHYLTHRFSMTDMRQFKLQPRVGDQTLCAVCLSSMSARSHRTTTTLQCGHSFHRGCVPRPWEQPYDCQTQLDASTIMYHAPCPLCRDDDLLMWRI